MPVFGELEVGAALARGADVEEDGLVALVDFPRVAHAFLLRHDLVVHDVRGLRRLGHRRGEAGQAVELVGGSNNWAI